MRKIIINICRLAFVGLFFFEVFNYLKIFKFAIDFTWLGLMITIIVVCAILEFVSYYFQKKCNRPLPVVMYLMAISVVFLDAAGDIFHFYSRFAHYDQIMHFFGGGGVLLFLYFVFFDLVKCRRIELGNFGVNLFALCITLMGGVLYEIEEYLEDYFFNTNRLGDGPDTANDLLMNLTGALLVLIIINICLKYFKKK